MSTITKFVGTCIIRDPVIKRALTRGLINNTALAKYLIKQHNMNSSLDAVLTAIRRNAEEIALHTEQQSSFDIHKVLAESRLSSKNKVVVMSLKKGESTLSLLPEIFSAIDIYGGEILKVIKGAESINLVFDEKNLQKISEIITQKKVKFVKRCVGEVTLYLDPIVVDTPGVFSYLLTELSTHNINIIEAVSCGSEYMLVVEEKDLLKTQEVLYGLYEEAKTKVKVSA